MINRRQFVLAAGAAAILRAVPAQGQTLPTTLDWTPLYPADKQRIWGDTVGDCIEASICYAMEMRNLIQGGAFQQLSELDLYWQVRTASIPPNVSFGVARESLWPFSLTFPTPAIPDPYTAQQAAINTPPNAIAVADRANFLCTDYESQIFFDEPSFTAFCKASIFAGYPISLFVAPNHQCCFWGWNDNINCWLGFNNSSTSPGVFEYGYDAAWNGGPAVVERFKAVAFNHQIVTDGYAITDAQLALLQSTWSAIAVPTITIDQFNTVQGILTAIAGTTTPPPPPPPPSGTITPGNGSLTDSANSVWTIGPAGNVLLNGVDAAGVWADSATIIANGHIQIVTKGSGYHQCTPPGVAQWSNC